MKQKRKKSFPKKIFFVILIVVLIGVFFFFYQKAKKSHRLPCIKNNICTNDPSICIPGGYCKMVNATDTIFRPIRIGICVCGETPKPPQNPPDLSKQKAE